AGLGGGSSDGANMLLLLNELFRFKLSEEKLARYALQLGSDCPFFIYNRPMYATGRGEVFEKIPEVLENYFICIVKPPFSISTAEAYQLVKPKNVNESLRTLLMLPIKQWKEVVINDFEIALEEKFPEINLIKKKFYEAGAAFSLMSGSGSSVYGIFEKEADAKKIFPDFECWSGKL
ncbi:MAG: 4-(cytidine 5'-diphospho)-2-C-methyl-D-erythritol kinase, partial [Bacteroidia bacterium]|nr:4-(cytidine 5'-diphospho)-2-C-methyl-D-erythritol kinase [Bacteroidia bacterium]